MRISDLSSDGCTSDLPSEAFQTVRRPPSRRCSLGKAAPQPGRGDASKLWAGRVPPRRVSMGPASRVEWSARPLLRSEDHADWRDREENGDDQPVSGRWPPRARHRPERSEEHTSELQSIMRISYD